MDTLYSMISALNAIGIYDCVPGNTIYNETETYAQAFDEFYSEADSILNECFIETAEGIGLEMYERLTGRVRDDLTLEKRREMIMALVNVKPNDFTPEGLQRFLESLDFDCSITEYPGYYEILIVPTENIWSKSDRELFKERLSDFLPCHLTCTVEFRISDWDIYDGLNNTFDDWDAMELTWNALDSYEGD